MFDIQEFIKKNPHGMCKFVNVSGAGYRFADIETAHVGIVTPLEKVLSAGYVAFDKQDDTGEINIFVPKSESTTLNVGPLPTDRNDIRAALGLSKKESA